MTDTLKARRRNATTHIPPMSRTIVRRPRFRVGDIVTVGASTTPYIVVKVKADSLHVRPERYWLSDRHDKGARSVLMRCCRHWRGDDAQ